MAARRVLMLAPSSGLGGGIERYVATLEQALRSTGNEVRRLNVHRPDSRFARSAFVVETLRQSTTWRPNVVLYMHQDLFPIRAASNALAGAATVGWIYGNEVFSTANRALFARGSRGLDTIATISAFTAAEIVRARGIESAIPVIRPALSTNWIETVDSIHTEKSRTPLLLTVTRFGPEIEQKGIPTLLRVARRLRQLFPDFELSLVGDGPRRREMESMAELEGCREWCRFAGHLSDDEVIREMKRSWAFALPSRLDESIGHGEGFGYVYLEAASAALPVVGSSDGGAAEAVRHEVSGFAIDPRDEEGIGAACARLLADPKLRERMGRSGRRWVAEEFQFSRLSSEAESLMETL